ncbi:MAG: hypothetical protein HLUCCX10_17585 [Algoriphagus marincola HL-49]|uniref:Uncharacterized protein n=1 Tax=Algoriphagus marincola HL-49 TaxID=1305737 RepID=A0A0P7XIJ8_9BACT|nr:MAG: hypothetical protein HLUCCX10_17585 [Algoriphagus marincola HL-49]
MVNLDNKLKIQNQFTMKIESCIYDFHGKLLFKTSIRATTSLN